MRFRSVLPFLLLASLAAPLHAADWLYLTAPGDTLIGIGKLYLKNPADWPKVQSANGLPIPQKLPANTRIKIPVSLLKVTPAPVIVTAVTGNARYKTANGPFQPLKVGVQLQGGETVLTGPRSSAAYRFADNTTLTQQDSSRLTFGRLAAFGKTGMVSTELSLDNGRLEANATKQMAPAGGFRVKTPVAVAGLRGTSFRLNLDGDGGVLRNEVLEGTVAVAAKSREVRVAEGYGTVTEKGRPPAQPRPLLPAPDAAGLPDKILPLPLEFAWREVEGAKGYRAQVARDATFPEVLLDNVTEAPRVTWGDELPDGQYFLRLRAIDAVGLEGHNLTHAFELDARPLPPLLISPALGERLFVNDVVLTWAAAEGAQGYLLQIAPTPEFNSGVLERRLPAITRHAETLPDGDWHWRAASLDERGRAHLWGPHRAFRAQPLPGAPAGGTAKAAEGTADFSWQSAKGAARYGFEVDKSHDMREPLIRKETENTAFSAELQPGKYHWRARGVEAEGLAGAWSEASPVIMPPLRPTHLMARVEGGKVLIEWKGEAKAYRVELARDSGFVQTVLKQNTASPQLSVDKPVPGDYWVRVVALGEDGVESPVSEVVPLQGNQHILGAPIFLLVPFF